MSESEKSMGGEEKRKNAKKKEGGPRDMVFLKLLKCSSFLKQKDTETAQKKGVF